MTDPNPPTVSPPDSATTTEQPAPSTASNTNGGRHRLIIITLLFATLAIALAIGWWRYRNTIANSVATQPPIVSATNATPHSDTVSITTPPATTQSSPILPGVVATTPPPAPTATTTNTVTSDMLVRQMALENNVRELSYLVAQLQEAQTPSPLIQENIQNLNKLISTADSLPLAFLRRPPVVEPTAQSSNWHNLWGGITTQLSKWVRIERTNNAANLNGRSINNPLSVQEEFMMRTEFRMHLMSARIALLAHDASLLHDESNKAQQILERHMDTQTPAVVAAINNLKTLAALPLKTSPVRSQ